METFFNNIIAFLQELAKDPSNNIFLYIILFLSAVIENIFPPIPGDTITAFGAFLVGTGILSYLYVYISTTLGSVIGFISLFYIGKLLGKNYFIEKDYKFFPKKSIDDAEKWFSKYGYYVVLANRFLPGVRSVISIVSGISNLSLIKVFFYSLISASIWNLIWIHTGYLLGENWDIFKEKITYFIKTYNLIVGGILLLAILIFFFKKFIKNRKE